MYPFFRDLLFRLDPETAHELSLDLLAAAERLQLLGLGAPKVAPHPVTVMGLTFPNPVGLAAGLDKNGDCIDAMGRLGFGFVEIGTITPKPQPGNPRPRLFRIPEQQAIINRMGFNNKGVDHLVERASKRCYAGILGINIGKNVFTPVENAVDDYLAAMQKVYAQADYITVNISSPNTPGLRDLQFGESLNRLLERLKQEQTALAKAQGRYVPLAVKIAPDMDEEAIKQIAGILLAQGMDGVIATNTTISREGVESFPVSQEAGGLSGLPVQAKSTQLIAAIHAELRGQIPIIGVGGIVDGASAAEKIKAGASLVQIYTGFIYRGPALIAEAAAAVAQVLKATETPATDKI